MRKFIMARRHLKDAYPVWDRLSADLRRKFILHYLWLE